MEKHSRTHSLETISNLFLMSESLNHKLNRTFNSTVNRIIDVERIKHWTLPHKLSVQLRRGHVLGDGRPGGEQTITGFTFQRGNFQSLASSMVEVRHLNQSLSEALQQGEMGRTMEITPPNTTFHLQPDGAK